MKKRLSPEIAEKLGLKIKEKEGIRNPIYYLNAERQYQLSQLVEWKSVKQTIDKNGKVITEVRKPMQKELMPIPKHHFIKAISTNATLGQQWIKTDTDTQKKYEELRIVVEELKKEIKPIQPTSVPITHGNENLINQYTLTDYHLGMMAWGEETGADWDIKIAEETLIKFFHIAIELSPKAGSAIFAQIGDFLHWDGLLALTNNSGHVLDADTRFRKLIRIAIRVIRRIIDMLLRKYKVVYLIMAEGNHDEGASAWLSEMFDSFYADEPRLIIDTNPDPYYCITFGKNCLFYHHGHKRNITNIDGVFVAKFKEQFGKSKYVYAHTGHLHNQRVMETNLMLIEQHRTLASKDAYASRGGWMSDRDSKVITYHKEYGEVSRVVINYNMLK